MTRVIVLDTNVLGLLVHPRTSSESEACRLWITDLLAAGDVVVLPEIADYEIRREFLRRNVSSGLRRLDALHWQVYYVPITTLAMRQAATFWAQARQQGHLTASPAALDADVILAAQASLLTDLGDEIIVATTNIRHLAHFVTARHWPDI
jgi:predicted nucleic acid-binding protein